MPDSNYALAYIRQDEELVHVRLTGPFEVPLTSDALHVIEQAAYFWSFTGNRGVDPKFIVHLPAGLTDGQCVLIDNAIFRGLITRGKKGSWSSLASYPD